MNLNLHFWSSATVVCWSNIRSPLIAFQTILHSSPEFPPEISGVDLCTLGPCSAIAASKSNHITRKAHRFEFFWSFFCFDCALVSIQETLENSVGDERDKNIP